MIYKGLAKEDIVADTLLLVMFPGRGTQNECCVSMLCKLGNICCGHENQKHLLCPQKMLRARANGEAFVSATMCPRLPGP